MNEMRKLMEAVERIDEKWDAKGIAGVIYREIEDEFSPVRKAFNSSNEPYRASIYAFGQHSGLYNPETLDGSENYHKLVDELELLVAGPEERFMSEDYYDSSLDVRKITNKLHEMMDEQMLDPRAVADAALTYMSESDVAEMARTNELIYDDGGDDEFEESVEVVGEAHEEGAYSDSEMVWDMMRDLRKLKENTAAVYAEASLPRTKERADYTAMLLNELRETLQEIDDIYQKYSEIK